LTKVARAGSASTVKEPCRCPERRIVRPGWWQSGVGPGVHEVSNVPRRMVVVGVPLTRQAVGRLSIRPAVGMGGGTRVLEGDGTRAGGAGGELARLKLWSGELLHVKRCGGALGVRHALVVEVMAPRGMVLVYVPCLLDVHRPGWCTRLPEPGRQGGAADANGRGARSWPYGCQVRSASEHAGLAMTKSPCRLVGQGNSVRPYLVKRRSRSFG